MGMCLLDSANWFYICKSVNLYILLTPSSKYITKIEKEHDLNIILIWNKKIQRRINYVEMIIN